MKLVSSQARPQINLEEASVLGKIMQRARESRQLSAQEVADKLLLSKNQIQGLETGNPKYFYGSKLYGQAAEKYAAFLELAESPGALLFERIDEIQVGLDVTNPLETPTIEDKHPDVADPPSGTLAGRLHRGIVIVASLLILAVIGIVINSRLQNNEAIKVAAKVPTVNPIQSETPPQAATVHVPAVPETTPVKIMPTSTITLKFNGSSWVQVVLQNGNKQEKTYRAGETLTLEPEKLQALVIGNANNVTMSNSKSDVKLSAFIAQGSQVARLIGPQIRNIGQ